MQIWIKNLTTQMPVLQKENSIYGIGISSKNSKVCYTPLKDHQKSRIAKDFKTNKSILRYG